MCIFQSSQPNPSSKCHDKPRNSSIACVSSLDKTDTSEGEVIKNSFVDDNKDFERGMSFTVIFIPSSATSDSITIANPAIECADSTDCSLEQGE